jgi:hypothetical protein
MAAGLVLALLAVQGAAKRAPAKPSDDCQVYATLPDGTTEPRDCYILEPSSKDLRAGTKVRFESCTG